MRNILRLFALTMALGIPISGAAQTAPRPDADPRIEKIVAGPDGKAAGTQPFDEA